MDASCGPSSALSQLSKHTQRDNSLQHEAARQGHGHGPQAAFRNQPGLDASLNRDFQQFSQGGGLDHDIMNGQAHNFPRQQFGGGIPNQFRHHDQPNEQQQWAQDFNRLSLGNNTQMRPEQGRQAQTANWSQQFLQHKQQNAPTQSFRPESSYSMQQPMFNQVNLQMMQGQQMMQQMNREQNQMNDVDQIDSKAFDAHFDQISKEMDEMEQVETTKEDPDKEAFAKAARQVENHMTSTTPLVSAETSSKFQQSNFLKLMSMISNREVEVSKEGDTLVVASGEDFREYLSDPLKHERSEINGAEATEAMKSGTVPQESQGGTITNESAHIRSHLPDPLAHIKDGELLGDLSSLQAARVISGGQVEKENWMEDQSWDFDMRPRTKNSLLNRYEQEVYDDYRNDDDFH